MIQMSDDRGLLGSVDDRPGEPMLGPFDVLADALMDLAEFVAALDERNYTCKSEFAGGGTIGGHVRHCLDHVRLLLDGIRDGVVDYDRRKRNTDVERLPHCAFDAIRELSEGLREAPPGLLSTPIRVRGLMTPHDPPVESWSTVGRELMFVVSHTIHHNAMIAAAARRFGAGVPSDFGIAPATIAFRSASECAPLRSSR